MSALLLIHAAATLYMTGLIWFVQVVHYPLLGRVGSVEFCTYENGHCRRTTWVVLPPMVLELASAVVLVVAGLPGPGHAAALAGLAAVAAIWLSTFFVQAPLHGKLCAGFDAVAHRRLVLSNWLRTILWTGRSSIALFLLAQRMQ